MAGNSNSQETSVAVNWQDQERINKFSSLLGRSNRLKDDINLKKDILADVEDALMEMELLDDEDQLWSKLSDSFVPLTVDQMRLKCEDKKKSTMDEIDEIESKLNTISSEMKELKTVLYSKFGNQINLD